MRRWGRKTGKRVFGKIRECGEERISCLGNEKEGRNKRRAGVMRR